MILCASSSSVLFRAGPLCSDNPCGTLLVRHDVHSGWFGPSGSRFDTASHTTTFPLRTHECLSGIFHGRSARRTFPSKQPSRFPCNPTPSDYTVADSSNHTKKEVRARMNPPTYLSATLSGGGRCVFIALFDPLTPFLTAPGAFLCRQRTSGHIL